MKKSGDFVVGNSASGRMSRTEQFLIKLMNLPRQVRGARQGGASKVSQSTAYRKMKTPASRNR